MELTEPQRERELTSGFRRALGQLGERLRERQVADIELDLYAPASGEVRFGLASRQFRLLSSIASNPMLWERPHVDPFLRSMVDTRILAAWLIGRGDAALYEQFIEFGRGRLKLQKLHLEDFIDAEDLQGELAEHLELLSARVNEDMLEEFQEIDLGSSFAGISTRKMAEEVGLRRLYNLDYQPLSAEAHGQWDSLLEWDLFCSDDPLHQGHRLGRFAVPEGDWHPSVVGHAYLVGVETIAEIFRSFGVDVSVDIETCATEMTMAVRSAREARDA